MRYPPSPKFHCEFCGYPTVSRVQKSVVDEGVSVRRWRVCQECGDSFTTTETVILLRPRKPMHRTRRPAC
jgi:transcriptional regulator NrdR family protein